MNYDQFKNLSCYEEFEIQCTLAGVSKIDVLKEIGHKVNDYYFFISKDGIFNWFDLEGNHIEDPGILKELKEEHIPENITKCVIPNSVKNIDFKAFAYCELLTSITIPNNAKIINAYVFWLCDSLKEVVFKGKTLEEVKRMKYYPFGIADESIIKVSEI